MLLIMTTEMKAKRKPLSFSTTMRNPDRIAGFLNQLLPYENQILTSKVIYKIIHNVIKNKLYKTMYEMRVPKYKQIFESEDLSFNDEQVEDIILHSPQKHKEAGFEYGWESRFQTWYGLPQEFGFVLFEKDKTLKISNTGHMLIDAYNEETPNNEKIQNVFLNAMMKYQTNNPFKKNSNSNVPLLLLLNTIKLLKEDPEENDAGIFRNELSILICWADDDAKGVYHTIKQLRKSVGFNYSDEYMYNLCLEILGYETLEEKESVKNYYKMEKICGEAIDEYIRKMRSTGILSLRGNGRFLDINTFENEKIEYVISEYSSYKQYDTKEEYYEYMGMIDNNILTLEEKVSESDKNILRVNTLLKFAESYSSEKIYEELQILSERKESHDSLLKFIPAPTRLEFLTSIAFAQNIKDIVVNPNYAIDDEGLPTMTAGGNTPDIVCYDNEYNSLVEVTLMCGRSDQVNNEIIPIRRHLIEMKKEKENSFSLFVAPVIHEDTKESTEWYKHKDNVDIIPLTIIEMINQLKSNDKLRQFLV